MNIDSDLKELIRLGFIERVGKDKFRITEKGKRDVENRILPSVGMTEKLFNKKDGLKEYCWRDAQRQKILRDKSK